MSHDILMVFISDTITCTNGPLEMVNSTFFVPTSLCLCKEHLITQIFLIKSTYIMSSHVRSHGNIKEYAEKAQFRLETWCEQEWTCATCKFVHVLEMVFMVAAC